MPIKSQDLVDCLVRELTHNTGFIRIHAAEALAEHGYGHRVSEVLSQDAGSTVARYRVGVWRVLARIAADAGERRKFIERTRRVMLDTGAPDRLNAVESLAKLDVASRHDRPAIESWLATADDATTAFPIWLLVLSNQPAERANDEARLARLLTSSDPVARLRASFALGRLARISTHSLARLHSQARAEPADSPARVYVYSASLLHAPRSSGEAQKFRIPVLAYLARGKANEQMEAATVIGLRGTADDVPVLTPLLKSNHADARIGAAGACLSLLR